MPVEYKHTGQGHNQGNNMAVSSVRLESNGYHDHLMVYSRGVLSGVLTLRAGDGETIAKMLVQYWEVVT